MMKMKKRVKLQQKLLRKLQKHKIFNLQVKSRLSKDWRDF
jgi:hypothetical protein